MDNISNTTRQAILKCFSIFLMIFAMIFSFTWKKFFTYKWEEGYCIGDNFLTSIGLKAWSNETSGTHYTVFYSLGMLLIAFYLYSSATNKKTANFVMFICVFLIAFFLANIMM